MRSLVATWLLGSLLALPSARAQATAVAAAPRGLRIELPNGPVRDAWERVLHAPRVSAPANSAANPKSPRDTAPRAATTAPTAPTPATSTLATPTETIASGTWARWSAAITRRDGAQLVELAAAQQRFEDAWHAWSDAVGAHAAPSASFGSSDARDVLASLVVGHALARANGAAPAAADASFELADTLPDDVVLRPALPPQPPGPIGTYQRCAMAARGLAIGAAIVDLEIRVELDGAQIDVTHVSGGACNVAIALPTMPQFALEQEYADWEEQPLPAGRPIALAIRPGDERHTLWGRFKWRPSPWPARFPAHLPAHIQRAGIVILTTRDDPRGAELEDFALALRELTRAPCEVRRVDALARLGTEAPLEDARGAEQIDLCPSPAGADDVRARKWLGLASLVERWSAARATDARTPREPMR